MKTVILLGDGGVGKTELSRRLAGLRFSADVDDRPEPTTAITYNVWWFHLLLLLVFVITAVR